MLMGWLLEMGACVIQMCASGVMKSIRFYYPCEAAQQHMLQEGGILSPGTHSSSSALVALSHHHGTRSCFQHSDLKRHKEHEQKSKDKNSLGVPARPR